MKAVPPSQILTVDQIQLGMLFTERWRTDSPGFWWFGQPDVISGIYREQGKWRIGNSTGREEFLAYPPSKTFILGARGFALPALLCNPKPRTPLGPWALSNMASREATEKYKLEVNAHDPAREKIRKQQAAWDAAWEHFYPAFWRALPMVWMKLEGTYDIWGPSKKAPKGSRKKRPITPSEIDLEFLRRDQEREDNYT